jgi:hypothetical protein
MADVTFHFSTDVYQGPGSTTWTFNDWGDRESYWGFSVRPIEQADYSAVLDRVSSNMDHNLRISTDITVTVTSAPGVAGGLLRFTAVQVTR